VTQGFTRHVVYVTDEVGVVEVEAWPGGSEELHVRLRSRVAGKPLLLLCPAFYYASGDERADAGALNAGPAHDAWFKLIGGHVLVAPMCCRRGQGNRRNWHSRPGPGRKPPRQPPSVSLCRISLTARSISSRRQASMPATTRSTPRADATGASPHRIEAAAPCGVSWMTRKSGAGA
jgi:hypothetical protein